MTESIYNEIGSIIKSNIIYRFALELDDTNDKERKIQISKVIALLNNKTSEESVKIKKNKMFEDIDIQVYNQKWSKLDNYHREVKIKEYIKREYNDHKYKEQLLEILLEKLNDNKLKTRKYIRYDSSKAEITSINNLEENDDGFKFTK